MIDIVVILFIALFTWRGYRRGFARTLLSGASTILSIVLGMILLTPVSMLLLASPLGNLMRNAAKNIAGGAGFVAAEAIAMIIASVLSFIIITVFIRIIIWVVSDALKIVTKLPIIKQANNILGLITGVVTAIVICYTVFGIIAALNAGDIISDGSLTNSIEKSLLGAIFYKNNALAELLI